VSGFELLLKPLQDIVRVWESMPQVVTWLQAADTKLVQVKRTTGGQ